MCKEIQDRRDKVRERERKRETERERERDRMYLVSTENYSSALASRLPPSLPRLHPGCSVMAPH